MRLPIDNVQLSPAIGPSQYPIYISQVFGVHPEMYAKFGLKGHDGLDIACPVGTPVYAPCDGFIIQAENPGRAYGLRIEMVNQDGLLMFIFGHLSELKVANEGLNVHDRTHPIKEGDIIALSGGNPFNADGTINENAGNSTGPHLHYGAYQFDSQGNIINKDNGFFGAIDPMKLENNMNTYVKTINLDGEVGAFIPLSDPSQIDLLNKIFGLSITINADNSIPTDIKAHKE